MNAFGLPLAIHGPKKPLVSALLVVAAGMFWLGWLALHQDGSTQFEDRVETGWCVAIGLGFAIWALWLSRRRVILYPEGISYSSIFGEKQIRWTDLTRFYYQATKQSINFVPVGTYYWFRLIDSQGQKMRFGSGLSNTAILANKLLELTQVPLLNKIASEFDTGIDVDFGPIRIQRQNGISVKKSFGRMKQIPWNELHSYAIQSGHFYIWRVGEKRTTGPAIANVPNAFALLGLLNIILKPSEAES
jgi:hypothetical protein